MRLKRSSALLILATVILPAAMRPAATALAQERGVYKDSASAKGVVVSLKGGVILTMPRRELPSLLVGETTVGTGEISSTRSEIGVGNRYGLEILIPFNTKLAIATEFGVETYVAKYTSEATGLPVRLD